MKNWIYKFCFEKLHLAWLKKAYEKGYQHAKADSEYQISRLKYEIERAWLVNPDKIISIAKSGIIMLNGEQVGDREIANLKSEVRSLKNFQLYDILQETLKQKAIEKGVLSSDATNIKNVNPELLASKMIIFSLDIIKTIVERIDKYKVKT